LPALEAADKELEKGAINVSALEKLMETTLATQLLSAAQQAAAPG